MHIRPFASEDSVEGLTTLLHSAYKSLAERGYKFWASYQNNDDTFKRIAQGECYMALDGDQLVGTITLNTSPETCVHPWYEQEHVVSFDQFAVLPDHQRKGVGGALLDYVQTRAQELGYTEIACDCSKGAADLVTFYKHQGFVEVSSANWDTTNYESVILSKKIR